MGNPLLKVTLPVRLFVRSSVPNMFVPKFQIWNLYEEWSYPTFIVVSRIYFVKKLSIDWRTNGRTNLSIICTRIITTIIIVKIKEAVSLEIRNILKGTSRQVLLSQNHDQGLSIFTKPILKVFEIFLKTLLTNRQKNKFWILRKVSPAPIVLNWYIYT